MYMYIWQNGETLTSYPMDRTTCTRLFVLFQYYTYKKMFRHIFRLSFKLRFFYIIIFWCLQTTLRDNSEFKAFFFFFKYISSIYIYIVPPHNIPQEKKSDVIFSLFVLFPLLCAFNSLWNLLTLLGLFGQKTTVERDMLQGR